MNKLIIIATILLLATLETMAQKYFDIYQNDVVVERIDASNVDSIGITEIEPIYVNFYHDNSIFLTYARTAIDSIKVYSEGGKPFSYAGVMGFNQELYPKDINVLATSTVLDYKSFIDNLPKKDGTILYYAVDNTLDMINAARIATPLSSVNMITFTDGLDQGSLMMSSKYDSSDNYLTAMSQRIREAEMQGIPINAYAVGLRGNDVSDVNLFKKNLSMLATSEENAFEVNSIYDLSNRFQSIANQIINTNTRQTVSLKIPGTDNGTHVRFTFDGNSPEDSKLYIEGTFNLKDRSLHDVTFCGMTSDFEKFVQGTQNGIFVTYSFTGLQRTDGNGLIPTNNIRHYYRNSSSTSWQRNSEFTPDGNTQRNDYHSGTAVILLLDCSSSLGSSDFSNVKNYAKDFLNMVAANTMPLNITTPKNVKAAIDEDKFVVNVTWDPVEDAESYDVYRSNTYYGSNNFKLVEKGITEAHWTDETPIKGSNYYKIVALGHGVVSSMSDYSNKIEFILSYPKNIKVVIDDNELVVNVSWDAVKYAESYNVYRNSSYDGDYEKVAEGITTTSWKDVLPLTGDNYYKIEAVNKLQSSISSYKRVNVVLDTPHNVSAVLDNNDDNELVVNVSWDAVKYAKSYNIYRSVKTPTTTYDFFLVAEGVTSNSWTQNVLSNNHTYYYKVQAVANSMNSSISWSTDGVKVFIEGLNAPTNVRATLDADKGTVNVTWDAVSVADCYTVYRSNGYSGLSNLVIEDVTSTSWTDLSPLEGDNYYQVRASVRNVKSGGSEIIRAVKPSIGNTYTVNGVTFKMVKVDGGTFQMGSTDESNYYAQPVHDVTLSDYYIGETEVTHELWKAVMGKYAWIYSEPGDKRPVEHVSWNDCQTFIKKLNELTGHTFRLPTEAEWEYAAKGGNQSRGYYYSGSDSVLEVAWWRGGKSDRTYDVATKNPNELGIYDMSGNVGEWCNDWFSADYYSSSETINPQGPFSGSDRVVRGHFHIHSLDSEHIPEGVTNRDRYWPQSDSDMIGFRLALSFQF